MWEQIPAFVFVRFDHLSLDMGLGVAVAVDNLVFFARSLGLDGCVEEIELHQVNVIVQRVLFFSPFITGIDQLFSALLPYHQKQKLC